MTWRAVVFAGIICSVGPVGGIARADIDLNGPWYLATNLDPPYGPSGCVVDVVQTGSALAVDGYCLGTFQISLSGTIDPIGGAYSASGDGGTGCETVSIAGTASPFSDGFSGTFTCDALSGPFAGGRCGNEILDPGEECDPGIMANTLLVNPCCSSACEAAPAGMACGPADICAARECNGLGACRFVRFDDGTPCTDDGNVCTDDVCDGGGVCAHRPNTAPCSDGNFCTTGDGCRLGSCVGACSGCCGGPACRPLPSQVCKGQTTTAGLLKAKLDSTGSQSQRTTWGWKNGVATSVADFGEPHLSTDYAVCVYRPRTSSGAVDLVLAADVVGGEFCLQASGAYRSCWSPNGAGFEFKNPRPSNPFAVGDGVRRMSLRAGPNGKASIRVKAIGSRLRTQLYAGLDPVIVQLRASNGACWTAGYVDPAKDLLTQVGTVTRFDYRANRASPSGAFLDWW